MHASRSSNVHARVGIAGWAIRKDSADRFGTQGSHLERYAATFDAVEINSSFYRPHRRATYERWSASVPAGFRFAVKVPRTITHEHLLVGAEDLLARFLDEVGGLGASLGPLLVQTPPRFAFDAAVVLPFFDGLRRRFTGLVACEPRHATWFEGDVDERLAELRIARVAADPALVPAAGEPGGDLGLAYLRMHGTPTIYRSRYGSDRVAAIADALRSSSARESWCIFDNTAAGAAPFDALDLLEKLA